VDDDEEKTKSKGQRPFNPVACGLVFLIGILFCTAAARSQTTVDIGGIMTVHYINGGDGSSPLVHNEGLPGFDLVADLFVNLRVSDEATVFIELERRGWNVQLYSGSLTYKISEIA
jgi:hypothetical protein